MSAGIRFDEESHVDDVGVGGMYVRLTRSLAPGEEIDGTVTLPAGATIAARGRVLRSEPREDGRCGIAVQFTTAELGRDAASSA